VVVDESGTDVDPEPSLELLSASVLASLPGPDVDDVSDDVPSSDVADVARESSPAAQAMHSAAEQSVSRGVVRAVYQVRPAVPRTRVTAVVAGVDTLAWA